jgi:hypothetical protein
MWCIYSYQILSDEPVSFTKDLGPEILLNPEPPPNMISKERFDYLDELEMYAKEDTEMKKSFRDRFRSVVNSVSRESHQRQLPMVGQSEEGVYMEMGAVSIEQAHGRKMLQKSGDSNADDDSSVGDPDYALLTPREAIIRESISRNQVNRCNLCVICYSGVF